MGFVWVQDVGVGDSVDSADITEIRANVDTTDDEKCAVHCSGDHADHDDGVDATHYPGYLNDDNGTYQSGYKLGVDTTLKTGYCSGQNPAYEINYLGPVLYDFNYPVNYGENSDFCEEHIPG